MFDVDSVTIKAIPVRRQRREDAKQGVRRSVAAVLDKLEDCDIPGGHVMNPNPFLC